MRVSAALHGGDVAHLAAELGCDPDEILDFSANINPRGLTNSARGALTHSADQLRRYPDWKLHPLRTLLAERHNIPASNIVLGTGASALILDTFRALRPTRCLCFIPAFAEYRRACEAVGAEFHSSLLRTEQQFRLTLAGFTAVLNRINPDLVVLNNPHNPSGSLIERDLLEQLLHLATDRSTAVLIDEAFIDYSPANAITPRAAELPRVVAIRSLTKFYGCPGLRVGYLVTESGLAKTIDRQMPAWPIGTLALNVLAHTLGDKCYEETTLEENARGRARFALELQSLGLSPYPSATNFFLVRLPENWPSAATLKSDLLANHRILIRDCSSFEGLEPDRFIRLAVLNGEQNHELVNALSTYA